MSTWMSGDNGLLGMLFLLFFGLICYIVQNRRYYKKCIRKMLLDLYNDVEYKRYCKIHRAEITYQMHERQRKEREARRKQIVSTK